MLKGSAWHGAEDVFLFARRSIVHLTNTISKPWRSLKSLRFHQHKFNNPLMTKAIANKPLTFFFLWKQESTPPWSLGKAFFFLNCRTFYITWMWPPPSNSDHQDYYIFLGNPYKPSFTTVTGRGPHPIYNCLQTHCFLIAAIQPSNFRPWTITSCVFAFRPSVGVCAVFGAPKPLSSTPRAVGSPAKTELVEAEATSLTTYRQNIGILDVWGKPREKKNSQGRWALVGVDGDSDMMLTKIGFSGVAILRVRLLWILFFWAECVNFGWYNCNCTRTTFNKVVLISCAVAPFFLLGSTSCLYSMVSFYFVGCSREEQPVKMLAHFAD